MLTDQKFAAAAALIVRALALIFCIAPTTTVFAQPTETEVLRRLQDGRHVLMIRHAIAPGTGDPLDFTLGDCRTQRNLDDSGRTQARAIGAWLKSRGIRAAQVYSSQWCRCLETASLMDFGEPTPLPALNSFYELTENREPNLRALRQFLAAQINDGSPRAIPLIMITHQVTISAITDAPTASGEGVLVEIGDNDRYTIRARLNFEQ